MSITINLEIGHDASLRTKTTQEGFTHDWEVFVKGCNGAEIHYYVEKVVFHLHETFPKPKRVVKEPPYSLRTSGYAGFNLPIEIYLRNNQEPKKIKFNYDLQLQPRGPPIHNVQKEKYVFHSPSEEFRSKLLKGGGIVGSVGSTQEISDSRVIEEKNQMTSKPKFSGSDVPKKHKIKLEEPRNTDFLNLFGTPITKTTSKVSEPPKPKEIPKSSSTKPDKPVDKDKSKTKNPYKDKEKEKLKDKDKSSESSEKKKEEKRKSKEDKNKDRDRVKEKSSKKDKEREKSPASRPKSPSPKRSPKRPPSPPPQKHSSSKDKDKDQFKEEKKEKDRKDEKKSKKEKREHKESKHKDRDKEKEHKEHKNRDSKSSKESSSANLKEKDVSPAPITIITSQSQQKVEKKERSKDLLKETKDEEKSEKSRSEKSEDKQKHKHKKKDKKEKREDKHSLKTEKKSEKLSATVLSVKEEPREPHPVSSSRDMDKNNLFGSPKSEPPTTPNQTDSKEKPVNNLTFKDEDISNDSLKPSSRESSPPHRPPSKSPTEPPTEPVKKPEPEKKKEETPKKKEKKEKKKDKKSDRDHEKRRKRKSPQTQTEVEQPPEKVLKEKENNNSDDERKVSSTEDANPMPKNEAEDYMGMLRDLQHKIMGLKDNSDLQKVVQLIAETGRYEVSAHTFDFDLCLLDRSTVRQLQDFFASIS